MPHYEHLTPEEVAEHAVGFLTRDIPLPGELQSQLANLGIGHIFDEDDCELTPAEQELADMGVDDED